MDSILVLARRPDSWTQRVVDELRAAGAKLTGVAIMPRRPTDHVPLPESAVVVQPGGILLDLAGVPLPASFAGTERWYFVDRFEGTVLHRSLMADGRTLIEGRLRWYQYSRRRTFESARVLTADWPALAWNDQIRGLRRSVAPAEPTSSPPGLSGRWRAGLTTAGRRLGRTDEWSIGIVRRPINDLLEGRGEVDWAPNPKGAFLADPFGQASETGVQVLAERFTGGRGDLVSLGWNQSAGWVAPQPLLATNAHLSYPFVFSDRGQRYLLPESTQSGRLDLYRLDDDGPHQVTTLVDHPLVDPTVVRHDDRWYLFATDHRKGPNQRLNIYWAEDVEGPWQPHTLNPVKIDVRSSRPGGTPFIHQGNLCRPAQDCSTGYGAAVVFNRIDRLTPTEFSETPVSRLDPYLDRPHGLHTVSAAGDFTLVDGLRRRYRSLR